MEGLEIQDVSEKNIDDLIGFCIPIDKKGDRYFIEGAGVKKRWAVQMLKKFGSFAKIAYLNGRLAGIIQYQLRPDEKLVVIDCIFVLEKENLKKGIGKTLFQSLLDDMQRPKSYFGDDIPAGFVISAFQVPGRYPQSEFFKKMGFKQVSEDDPSLLYYPLKKDFVYKPKIISYIPQEEDKGRALIFYDPNCPFSIYFSEKIKESILEVAPDISVRMINEFEEADEVTKRGRVSFCIVNQKPIMTFFFDKENFQKEIKEALKN
uniref:N-acetyltransferase domain-containing protein n=1 Tax=candidate division WOR-3 bacterium TaxID=2052148 RepID=A0A7V0Z6E8_UNCW3